MLQELTKIDVMNARDFRLMDRQVVNEIVALGDKNLFFKGMANFVGFKKTTIKVETASRKGDTTKYTFKMLLRLALDALTSFSIKPLVFPLKFGVFSLMVGLVAFIVGAVSKSTQVATITSLIISIFQYLMLAMLLISLGVIGFYLGKIYDQVKGRPRYIIEERT